jgi:hypothetical protein
MVVAAVGITVGVLLGTSDGNLPSLPRSAPEPSRRAVPAAVFLEVPPDLSLPEGTGLRDPRVERLRQDNVP